MSAVASFSAAVRPPVRRRSKTVAVGVRCSLAAAPILDHLRMTCATPLSLLRRVADDMALDMRAGLAADGRSDLKMILSYVDSLPTGNEMGMFYALDLGGTNFRVLRVHLGGKDRRVVDTEFDQVAIPQELMYGTTEELFDFIASGLARFVSKESRKFQGRKREIGFTFSFPVKQTSIDSGILIKWTKGFAVSGTAGRDVVACLNEALKRQSLDMRVSALIVNTEWGAFSNGLPLSEFDNDVDSESVNPGEQIFEKTISGMYLGEIVRKVLLKMSEVSTLFGESVPDKLYIPYVLRTPDLCTMQQDDSDDLKVVGETLNDVVGVARSTFGARKIVINVCDTIVKRGGRLAGAGIVGILQKMDQDSEGLIFGKRTVVAMDGGLYENYPQYRNYLKAAVTELLGFESSKNVVIEHTKDGSGIGAALLAATNSEYTTELQ